MKLLYFGDLHERETTPSHRKDDFRETLNRKIEEIRQIGEQNNVRAFLQPGDFLDKPKANHTFLSEVVKRWGFADIQTQAFRLAKGEITPENIAEEMKGYKPIVGAIGNHELHGESLKSYPKTSLSLLEQIGFMHIPQKEEPIIFQDESGFSVAITAGHYDTKMDDASKLDVYIVDKKLADYHIHIVHGYLTNKDMGELFPHTPVDLIAKKTKADLTLAGHDHIGFKPIEVDGKWFVNSGSITRLTADQKEIKRKPKVLLIDIDKDKGITLTHKYLKSAKKGEEVLDRSHIAFQQSMSSKMEEIKSTINKSKVDSGLSITEIIRAISDSKNLDEKLKDKAIQAVTDKMDVISNSNQKAKPYYIEKIVLTNFQSHKHSTFELAKGMNVFTGKSGAGKSSIMRALAWVFENESKNPRRFIKIGEEKASVSIFLSNGYMITRLVEKKKNGKNGYEVYDPKTGDVAEYNTKSLPIIQEILGFVDLQIDEKKSIPMNFQKQGMSWFFIGDGFTNSDRAKIIGSIYQTHYVDAVIKDLESHTKKAKIRMKDKQKEMAQTEKNIQTYDDLPNRKKILDTIEEKLDAFAKKEVKLEKIKQLYQEQQSIECSIQQEQKIIHLHQNIEVAEKMFREWMKRAEVLISVKKVAKERNRLHGVLKEEEQNVRLFQHIEKAEEQFYKTKQKVKEQKERKEKLEMALQLRKQQEDLEQEIQKTESIIGKYQNLPKIESHFKTMERKIQVVRQAKPIVQELKRITESGKKERQTIEEIQSRYQAWIKEYELMLQQIGTCPTCKGTINATTIENISTSLG